VNGAVAAAAVAALSRREVEQMIMYYMPCGF